MVNSQCDNVCGLYIHVCVQNYSNLYHYFKLLSTTGDCRPGPTRIMPRWMDNALILLKLGFTILEK